MMGGAFAIKEKHPDYRICCNRSILTVICLQKQWNLGRAAWDANKEERKEDRKING